MNMKNEALKQLEWIEVDSFNELLERKFYSKGVYINWIPTEEESVALYVGQGDIRTRIYHHNRNEDIAEYEPSVFYAETDPNDRSGIEKYLSNQLYPVFGQRWPRVSPIPVNLPSCFD